MGSQVYVEHLLNYFTDTKRQHILGPRINARNNKCTYHVPTVGCEPSRIHCRLNSHPCLKEKLDYRR